MRELWRKHGQVAINMIVFFGVGYWITQYTLDVWLEDRLDFVEIAFICNNAIWLVLIVVRKRHVDIDTSIFHQFIALAAFFSGLAYVDPTTEHERLLIAAQIVILVSIALSTISLLNLGRSFGILIALREVKTGGLYRLIRHPMYFTDLTWKVGMLLKKPGWINAAIFTAATACYIYRILLEERFLSQHEQYREYMKKVRYRLIPGLF